MYKFIRRFSRDEDGAVTVDWVVLTALIIGIGSALYLAIASATNSYGGNVNTALTSSTVSTGDNDSAGGFTVAGTAGGGSSGGGSSSGGSSSGGSSSGGSSGGGDGGSSGGSSGGG